jgi:predicted molibdopterin-dependent oxidoreductase YjgC
MARADWQILVDMSQYFDTPLEYAEAYGVWEDIRRAVPKYAGITYTDLTSEGIRPEALQLA